MSVVVHEGIGYGVTGPETSHIEFVPNRQFVSASDLVPESGRVSWSMLSAQEFHKSQDPIDDYWRERLKEEQALLGGEYPIAHRIRITVECEPLSEEESRRVWDSIALPGTQP